MILPVRCFTCGSVTGHLGEKLQQLKRSGMSERDAVEALRLRRYCCRQTVFTSVDSSDQINVVERRKSKSKALTLPYTS